jgi:exodeoxyribonuclease VII large subunit
MKPSPALLDGAYFHIAWREIKYAVLLNVNTLTQIFSVSELNERIKERVETDIRLHDLWARGELSNVVNHRSGHRYFTLKDRESQLSCALFRNHGARLGFELKDGLNVLIFGDVDVYRPRGQVQLIVRGIRLDSGLGFRHQELERLKQKLASEGLFDEGRKRALPKYPACIGIVTSPDGAALRDVLSIIGPYPARIILSPAQVQGDGAPDSIAWAIRSLQGKADVVIVCRGGGSAEDLWAFNHELVARAIFECDSPVISAIGHETDVTIADFVADVRAPTPTAAAEMAVPNPEELVGYLSQAKSRMVRAVWSILERKQERLEYIEHSLSARKMYALVAEGRQRLDDLAEHLESVQMAKLETLRNRLSLSQGRLDSVSPLATLSRGYAIARSSDGRLILRAEDAVSDEVIELILSDGRLKCRVIEKM